MGKYCVLSSFLAVGEKPSYLNFSSGVHLLQTNINVLFGGNYWVLPSYSLSGRALPPTTTWLPSNNQGLRVCVPALIQLYLLCGPTGGHWPLALLLTCGDPRAEAPA